MTVVEKNYIFNADVAEKKMRRMAYEILENNIDADHIIFAGIADNGLVLAKSINRLVKEISNKQTQVIELKMDKKHPTNIKIEPIVDFNDKVVIIVDDVTNSGKTLTYALKPILDYFPKKIQTLVMIERSHKKFPVHPDYVGLSLSTLLQEHIFVEVSGDTVEGVYMV